METMLNFILQGKKGKKNKIRKRGNKWVETEDGGGAERVTLQEKSMENKLPCMAP